MMAKEETPVLAGVIPVVEVFMTKWESLARKRPSLKPIIDEGLHWATKYYIRMDKTNAYIIGMCKSFLRYLTVLLLANFFLVINPTVRLSWIVNNWEEEWRNKAIDQIKTLVSLIVIEI